MKKILLIIDMQKGFRTERNNHIFEKLKAINFSKYDKIFATKFVNSKKFNSNFANVLKYDFMRKKSDIAIDYVVPKNCELLEKHTYSLPTEFVDELKKLKAKQIDICGTDYDSCVLAIGFQLFDAGFVPKFYKDILGTHSTKSPKFDAIEKIYYKNFGQDCFL